jgi:hypothetical protein
VYYNYNINLNLTEYNWGLGANAFFEVFSEVFLGIDICMLYKDLKDLIYKEEYKEG